MVASAVVPAVEEHPLAPFVPEGAVLLMLGSFPPPRKRWSMDFFYPNFTNDMWRIFGHVFMGDRDYFVDVAEKRFIQQPLMAFLQEKGIALYDALSAVRRLQGNASDKFLESVRATDLHALLARIPRLRAVVTTGQKATEVVCEMLGVSLPAVGGWVQAETCGRKFRLYRMPSASRAYPMRLARKAEAYRKMLEETGVLVSNGGGDDGVE